MSSAEFTPGPWMVLPSNEQDEFVVLTANGHRIDLARTYGYPGIPREANANLIAAAPELFVIANHPALEWILTEGLSFIPEPQRSSLTVFLIPLRDAALAKARGEPS